MKDAVVFHNEKEFREWFDKNYERFNIQEIILNQEVCPDYVVKMNDGKVLKIEAELHAINFIYHKHDPSKVDLIIACYASEEEIEGVPVLAVHKTWTFEQEPLSTLPPEGPLSDDELRMLRTITSHSSLSLAALAEGEFRGDESIFMRVPPELATSLKGRHIKDHIFNIISPQARSYMRKYHHMLIASNFSKRACVALQSLKRRQLIKIRPIPFIFAAYDGVIIDYEGWVPSEAYPTDFVKKYHNYILEDIWKSFREGSK